MIKRSTLLHLRIPFSFFLLPIYMFALATVPEPGIFRSILIFVIIHIFLYPASNGYNSYFDRDEQSIGGLKKPPKVSKNLYHAALAFDAIALLLGVLISWTFTLMILIYGLVSKAYSHPLIRLKKYPWIGWLTIGLFQGFFTFITVYIGISGDGLSDIAGTSVMIPAALTSLLLWGSYPMTQVYQHEEDLRRGDISLSLRLGINGTFLFTAVFFSLANAAFFAYFYSFYHLGTALLFEAFLLPVLIFFIYWFLQVQKDDRRADFKHTMNLNLISSVCMNGFFLLLLLKNLQLI